MAGIVKQLTAFCSTGHESDLSDEILWNYMRKISDWRRDTFVLILPLLFQWVSNHPTMAKFPPKSILESITSIKIEDETTWAIIRLMPFLNADRCIEMLQTILSLFREALSKNREIPKHFISVFHDIVFDESDNKKISKIAHHISENLQDPEYLIVFAALSRPLMGYARGLLNMIELPGFSPPRQQRIAFSLYLREYSQAFALEGVKFDKVNIFTFLLNGLVCDSQALAKDSYKTISSMLKFFMDESFIDILLKEFKDSLKFPRFFFKVLSKFVRFAGKDHPRVLERIHGFLCSQINGDNRAVKPFCLFVLAEFAKYDSEWLKSTTRNVESEFRWLSKDKTLYEFLSPYFVAVARNGLFSKRFIDNCVKTLYEGLNDDSTFHLAIDLAVLSLMGYNAQDPSKLSKYLQSIDIENHTKWLTRLIIELKGELDKSIAFELFSKLKQFALTSTSYERVIIALKGMKNLLKFYGIPLDDSLPILEKIMNGDLPILYGNLPHSLQPPERVFFGYISAFFRRYPESSSVIAKTLVEWVKCTPFSGIAHVLKSLRVAVSKKIIEPKAIVDTLGSVASSLCSYDIDIVKAISATLKEMWISDPIPEIDSVAEILLRLVQPDSTEEEEAELAISSVMDLVFVMSSTTSRPLNIDKNLIQGIIRLVSHGITDSATILLCQMIRNPNIQFDAPELAEVMSIITSLALTVAFPDSVRMELKATMKAVFGENRALQRQITEPFVNSRHKMTKFQEFIS